MLTWKQTGQRGPLLVMLHWLGGGAQTWQEVAEIMASRGVRCIALDLPGFGASASISGYSLEEMTEQVAQTIGAWRSQMDAADTSWVLAGHSMGGAVATLLARRSQDGDKGLEDLRGLLLVSPSPPGPEPMPESKREELIHALGERTDDPEKDRKRAEEFLDANTGNNPLTPSVRRRAVEGIVEMNRLAFRMWLEHGSREDWRGHLGRITLPALILAGTEEESLGPKAQTTETLPFFPLGEVAALEGSGHLAPLERPEELAEYVTGFFRNLHLPLQVAEPAPGPRTLALLEGQRTAPQTRAVLQQRLQKAQDWNHTPVYLDRAAFRTLRVLVETIVPAAGFDLAAVVETELAAGFEDGWRFAALPPDRQAWKQGLESLDLASTREFKVPFVALHSEQRTALLQRVAEGSLGKGLLGSLHLGSSAAAFSAMEMKLWFEDARSLCTRLYMADPRCMDRVGFTGFADDLGFTHITLQSPDQGEAR